MIQCFRESNILLDWWQLFTSFGLSIWFPWSYSGSIPIYCYILPWFLQRFIPTDFYLILFHRCRSLGGFIWFWGFMLWGFLGVLFSVVGILLLQSAIISGTDIFWAILFISLVRGFLCHFRIDPLLSNVSWSLILFFL